MPTVGKVKKVSTVYLGIDPGASGGLALVADNGHCISLAMPKTERDIWEWFQQFIPTFTARTVAVIEQVHAMPGNGVAGMFKFGQSYGFLRACLIAASIPFTSVTPQTWQKGVGICKGKRIKTKTQHKNLLKSRAQELFPTQKVTLATADAILLAEYCRRFHQGS